jgi:hypothetical protein
MFSGFLGETVLSWRQNAPKAPFFEKYFPITLVETPKSSYILTGI